MLFRSAIIHSAIADRKGGPSANERPEPAPCDASGLARTLSISECFEPARNEAKRYGNDAQKALPVRSPCIGPPTLRIAAPGQPVPTHRLLRPAGPYWQYSYIEPRKFRRRVGTKPGVHRIPAGPDRSVGRPCGQFRRTQRKLCSATIRPHAFPNPLPTRQFSPVCKTFEKTSADGRFPAPGVSVRRGFSIRTHIRKRKNTPMRTASRRHTVPVDRPIRRNRQNTNEFRRTRKGFGGTLSYRQCQDAETEKAFRGSDAADYPKCPVATRYSAICTAFSAAPLRIWSLTHQNVSPLGSEISSRMRPT